MATHQKKHIQKKQSKFVEFTTRSEEENEEYGEIIGAKGSDARFEVCIISSNINVIAKARGCLIKGPRKRKILKGSIVLLQRDHSFTAEDKYFIIHVYEKDEVHKLEKMNELKKSVTNNYDNDNIGIDLNEDDDELDDNFIANI